MFKSQDTLEAAQWRTAFLVVILAFATMFLSVGFLAHPAEPTPVLVVQDDPYLKPATLFVHITSANADGKTVCMGSGVLDGNRVITAKHVLQNATCATLLIDGFPVESDRFYIDEKYDLGLIYLPPSWGQPDPMLLAPTSHLAFGSLLVVAGGPGGVKGVVVTQGIYGGHAEIADQFMWTGEMLLCDVHIARGNSGGGIFHDGQVVGIVVAQLDMIALAEPVEHLQEALARAEAAGFNL